MLGRRLMPSDKTLAYNFPDDGMLLGNCHWDTIESF